VEGRKQKDLDHPFVQFQKDSARSERGRRSNKTPKPIGSSIIYSSLKRYRWERCPQVHLRNPLNPKPALKGRRKLERKKEAKTLILI